MTRAAKKIVLDDDVDDGPYLYDWSKHPANKAPTWWTDERVAEFKKLWNNPLMTLNRIAEKLGTTKGAIAGKRDRLGLPNRSSAEQRARVGSTSSKKRKAK